MTSSAYQRAFPRAVTGQDFLLHTESALQSLFAAITRERELYKSLRDRYEKAFEVWDRDYTTADMHEDFDEIQVQYKFFQAAESKMRALLVSQSLEVLCGSVFQIAKQGISLALDGDARYSQGRSIGNQPLSNVIWHGRNQAMHWEDGLPTNPHTRDCFELLRKDFGQQFAFGSNPRNMAWDLWLVVDWNTYERYKEDMMDVFPQSPARRTI